MVLRRQSISGSNTEDLRLCMAHWNEYLPEWRRVCFNRTVTHSLRNFPSNDGTCRIYKVYKGKGSGTYIARNYYWTTSNGNYIVESDIGINGDYPSSNGALPDRYDVRTIFTHEIGHTVGLGHSAISDAVMYSYYSVGIEKRVLKWDDISGIYARYQ